MPFSNGHVGLVHHYTAPMNDAPSSLQFASFDSQHSIFRSKSDTDTNTNTALVYLVYTGRREGDLPVVGYSRA